MLERITPVILTHDEEANIARTLSQLHWAKDIVVVDSGSTDGTMDILRRHPKVRIFQRPFDNHHWQWDFAVHQTGVMTPWILRLDADYQLTSALIEEIAALHPDDAVGGYRVSFDYTIFSHRLISSLYPPNTILLRIGRFSIVDNGHTEGWRVDGVVEPLACRVVHDDWKSIERWLNSQGRYMRRECDAIASRRAGVRDWLRLRPPLMPVCAFLYCLFGKGLIFSGRAGLFYALQRLVAESVMSLMVLEQRLRPPDPGATPAELPHPSPSSPADKRA